MSGNTDPTEQTEPPEAAQGRGVSVPAFVVFLLAVGLLIIILAPGSSSPASSSTPTSAPAPIPCQEGIEIGGNANVVASVRLRQTEGYIGKTDADLIGFMEVGDTATVKGGPRSRDGLCWWQVEHKGIEGWAADHSSDGTLLLSSTP